MSTCLMPRLMQADVHSVEVNWAPLSVVTVAGTPKRATQLAMTASTRVLASMLHRGTVLNHLVDLSMIVSRYMWPSEEAGRGTTRSTCTWENLRGGMGMASIGAASCSEPSPSGTADNPGTWLPRLCPHPSTQNVQSPCVWWHVCQGGTRCE